MGTSAALEAHRADPSNKAALRVASQMLSATRSAMAALEQHPQVHASNPKFLVFFHLQVKIYLLLPNLRLASLCCSCSCSFFSSRSFP